MSNSSPIAIFDSGLGGLTVLKSLRLAYPSENFLYLGDTARLPYGTKSPETISNYIYQNIQYLKQYEPKAVVVACNSASSVLRPGQFEDLPIFGVIQPAAKTALSLTSNNRIGVIGTRATVTQKSYVNALMSKNPDVEVYQQSCPLFVPLVEEGWIDDPVTNLIVYRFLAPLLQAKIDTLIMGCTHYPLLTETIHKVCGPDVALVDPATSIVDQLKPLAESSSESQGELSLMCTDTASHFKKMAERILGYGELNNFQRIDL